MVSQVPGAAVTANEQFFDALVRHQIGLLRMTGKVQNDVARLLDKTETAMADRIKSRLSGRRGLNTPADVQRMQSLLKSIRATRLKAWKKVTAVWVRELREISKAEPLFLDAALKTVLPVTVETTLPATALLETIATSKPFHGKLLRSWARNVAAADLARISDEVRIGMVLGESNQAIARRVVGTKALQGADGATAATRRQAMAVTRTAVNAISNQSKRAFYEANKKLFSEELYVATLDSRTTPICSSLDGERFPVGQGPIPPLHIQCRSLRIAILDDKTLGARPMKPTTERGLLREYTKGNGLRSTTTRAGLPRGHKGAFDKFSRRRVREQIGRVPAKVTYQEWLTRQSAAFQQDVLGKTRARLFRRGGLTLDKFVDAKGRRFTLAELARSDKAAFQQAGLLPKTRVPAKTKVAAAPRATAAEVVKRQELAKEWMGGDKIVKPAAERIRTQLRRVEGKDFGLNDVEVSAIGQYSRSSYETVNQVLRNKGVISPKFQGYMDTINDGLAKMPVHKGMVFRGVGLKNVEAIAKQYKVGRVVSEPAFLSTTSSKNVSKLFANSVEESASKQMMFAIKSKTGAQIKGLANPDEFEVLFRPNTRFRVLEVTKSPAGTTFVTMEEVL